MINTSPIGSKTTYGDYANFLMQRHIKSHFLKGCTGVHLLFDNPGQLKNTPKCLSKREEMSLHQLTLVILVLTSLSQHSYPKNGEKML